MARIVQVVIGVFRTLVLPEEAGGGAAPAGHFEGGRGGGLSGVVGGGDGRSGGGSVAGAFGRPGCGLVDDGRDLPRDRRGAAYNRAGSWFVYMVSARRGPPVRTTGVGVR
jgi:hypothetical protein